nr:hypothetical protein [Tanacetum cinerariifolium]
DVPLGGEVDEPMVDPEFDKEEMDDDDDDDGNLKYRHGVLMRKIEEVSDAEVADSIAIGEIHPRVATIEEQVQVMELQAVQVVSGTMEIKTRVQQVESRVDTYPSG